MGLKIILLLLILLALAFWDSNSRIVVTEYHVGSDRLPASFEGFRIVQLSDLHADYADRMDYLVSKVEKAKPDIIAVTGDLIDAPEQLSYVEALMPRLTAIADVYYVTGNHEWPTGVIRDLFALLDELDVTVLRNDYLPLERGGETILLAGIDDPNGPADMKKPPEVIRDIRESGEDKYLLLLVHRNDWLKRYSELDVDCAVTGHGHGGLVRLPFTDGLINSEREFFPTYMSGMYEEEGTQMIVSRGLYSGGLRVRLFNNPHIPVIILGN